MSDALYHLGRVTPLQASTPSLLELFARHIEGDGVGSEAYFFRAEISNDLLDSHYTHMSAKTLGNYAEDAAKGVAFLRGHDWSSLPLGYSLTGKLETEGAKQRVTTDFYTVPGIKETDELIKRLRTGLLRDVSVGFTKGRMICDLCQRDFWDCPHLPGVTYEQRTGDTVANQLATFTIDDSRLCEVSGVFDGSTPDAMITKAERMAERGELSQKQIEVLETRLRRRFKTKTISVPGRESTKGGEMDVERMKTVLKVASEEEVFGAIEKLQGRVTEMEAQAEEGRQYRKDLVAEALAEGVRAQGNDFDAATYTAVLETASLPVIKRMRDDWRKAALAALPAGRSSVDTTSVPAKKPIQLVPDAAYGG